MSIDIAKRSLKFEKLVNSRVFRDSSAVAYALNAFKGLSQPDFNLMASVSSKWKTYTGKNFTEYLVDFCGVKPENKEKAMALLYEASH